MLIIQAVEEIAKLLPQIKSILYGDGGLPALFYELFVTKKVVEPSMETVFILSHEIHTTSILSLLVQHMAKLDFESKKDVGQIFNNLLRVQEASTFPTAKYLGSREDTLLGLIDAYVPSSFLWFLIQ
jgi:calcium binding protein 39